MSDAIVVLHLETKEFLLHLTGDFFHAGFTIEIVHLGGIGFQIIEFPSIDVVVEMDEFVAIVAHAVVATHTVLCGILVVVIVDALTPVFRVLSLEQRHERNARMSAGMGAPANSRKVGA